MYQQNNNLVSEMSQKTGNEKTSADRVRLPKGVVLLPPVSIEDLKKDIEHDPEGAEEFVALIRALRRPVSAPVTL
jgi:hypothetical protein